MRLRNLKTQQSLVILDLRLRKTLAGKSHDRDLLVLKKFRFRDGLVWTESATVEIKLRFQLNFSGVVPEA